MDPEAPQQKKKERRGPLGCLFTGTLGCGAFLGGAVLAAGFGAPELLAEPLRKWVESTASTDFDGSVRIERLDLALNSAQRVEGVHLFDPEGNELLVASIEGPSFLEWAGLKPDKHRYAIDLARSRIEIDESGVSNVARALGRGGEPLTWRRTVGRSDSRSVELQFDDGELDLAPWADWSLELRSDNLQWIDRREPRLDLDLRRLVVLVDNDARSGMSANFDFELDGAGRRGRLEGGLAIEGSLFGVWRSMDLTIEGEGIPTALFDRLAQLDGRALGRLGPLLDVSASVGGDPTQGAQLVVDLDDGAQPVRIEGTLQRGAQERDRSPRREREVEFGLGDWRLELESGEVPSTWLELWVGSVGFEPVFGPRGALAGSLEALEGGQRRRFEGSFESSSAFVEGAFEVEALGLPRVDFATLTVAPDAPGFSQILCTWILPWFEDLSFPDGGRPSLDVDSLEGLGGSDPRRIRGRLTLDLPRTFATLTPAFAQKLGVAPGERRLLLDATSFDLEIEAGVVHYSEVELPLPDHELTFSGSFDAVERNLALEAEGPIAIVARHMLTAAAAERLHDSPMKLPMRITGAPQDPEFLGDLDALGEAREVLEKGARILGSWFDEP